MDDEIFPSCYNQIIYKSRINITNITISSVSLREAVKSREAMRKVENHKQSQSDWRVFSFRCVKVNGNSFVRARPFLVRKVLFLNLVFLEIRSVQSVLSSLAGRTSTNQKKILVQKVGRCFFPFFFLSLSLFLIFFSIFIFYFTFYFSFSKLQKRGKTGGRSPLAKRATQWHRIEPHATNDSNG